MARLQQGRRWTGVRRRAASLPLMFPPAVGGGTTQVNLAGLVCAAGSLARSITLMKTGQLSLTGAVAVTLLGIVIQALVVTRRTVRSLMGRR